MELRDWDQAAAANGLYEIREPVGTSDVSANARNKNLLAWAQPDEPDGITSQVPTARTHEPVVHSGKRLLAAGGGMAKRGFG